MFPSNASLHERVGLNQLGARCTPTRGRNSDGTSGDRDVKGMPIHLASKSIETAPQAVYAIPGKRRCRAAAIEGATRRVSRYLAFTREARDGPFRAQRSNHQTPEMPRVARCCCEVLACKADWDETIFVRVRAVTFSVSRTVWSRAGMPQGRLEPT